jgi:RNA polymerase sigma-70 factor, ECF subfamily
VLDVESFATLLSQNYERCWLVAAAVTGDRVEADDIVQEASIVALTKLADFTEGTNFTAWISQIVRLIALNYAKKSNRRSAVATDPAMIDRTADSAGPPPNDALVSTSDGRLAEHQADFDDEVLSALRELSEEARACLLLRVVQRLAYSEIAKTLQIPEGTAMSHVHRAKQVLGKRLKNVREKPDEKSANQGQS